MKLNLGCSNDIRTGYINIDKLPCPAVSSDIFKQGEIDNLDWVAEDGTVDEIVALDCLQYIPYQRIKQTLANWSKKLIPTGKICLLVNDVHLVAKSFISGQINLEEFLTIIYGTKNINDDRVSCIDTVTLCNYLSELNLIVDIKRYDGIMIYLEAIKS